MRPKILGKDTKTGLYKTGLLFPFVTPFTVGITWQSIPDPTRNIPPVITTDWLSSHLNKEKTVIMDIREPDFYNAGHIPGSCNIPFSRWITDRNDLLLELPDDTDILNTIGSAGIESNSMITVVNKADSPYCLADSARVADTLIYAGLNNVSILDGGYDKWTNEQKETTRKIIIPDKKKYRGNLNKSMFVSKKHVENNLMKSVIIDARDPEVYFGLVREPFTDRAGHIPGAINLPAPWLWEDSLYREINKIQEIVESNIDKKNIKEIIIYCGVGGYTAAWWFILTQVMGYPDVKFYDGSAQEWSRDINAPLIRYKWE